MFCKKCGNRLMEGVKFCSKCGERTQQPYQQPIYNQVPPVYNQAPPVYNQAPVMQPPAPVLAPQIVVPRKKHGFGWLIATFIILFVLASALEVYIKFFVPGPDDCAMGFLTAFNNYDIYGMCDYLEDEDKAVIETELQVLGFAGNIANSLLSEAIGIDLGIDVGGILENMGGYKALSQLMGQDVPDFEYFKVVSVSYEEGEESEVVKKNPFAFLELDKVLCKTAYVTIEGSFNGSKFTETFKMVRTGFGEWKVSHDTMGSADILGFENLFNQMQSY